MKMSCFRTVLLTLLTLLSPSLLMAGEVHDCFSIRTYTAGCYHVECSAAGFEGIDFAVDDNVHDGWGVTTHCGRGWAWVVPVADGESIDATDFSGKSHADSVEFPGQSDFMFAFAWNDPNPTGTDHYGWVHLRFDREHGTMLLVDGALNDARGASIVAGAVEVPTESAWRVVAVDGGVELEGVSDGASLSGRVVLPEAIDRQQLVSIGARCFYGCDDMEALVIPTSVQNISSNAITECASLVGVFVPNSVTNLGECAFADNLSLRSVTIGSGVRTIPRCCFNGCAALKEVVIPSTVETIETEAFRGCSSLVRVQVHFLTEIGENAFPTTTDVVRFGFKIWNAGYNRTTTNDVLQLVKIVGRERLVGKTEIQLTDDPPLNFESEGASMASIRLGIYPSRLPNWAGNRVAFYFTKPTVTITSFDPVGGVMDAWVQPTNDVAIVQPPLAEFVHLMEKSGIQTEKEVTDAILTTDDYVSNPGHLQYRFAPKSGCFYFIRVDTEKPRTSRPSR